MRYKLTGSRHIGLHGKTYLAAVLTVVVLSGLEYGQVKLRHRLRRDPRVSLGQVVDQHAAPLEPKETLVALVDEPVIVIGRHPGNESSSPSSTLGLLSLVSCSGSPSDNSWLIGALNFGLGDHGDFGSFLLLLLSFALVGLGLLVHAEEVLTQLVFPLELLAAVVAQKLLDIGVPEVEE